MARRDLIQQAAPYGRRGQHWTVGTTIAYQSTIWRVQGLVFGVTAAGTPELRWVLDEQTLGCDDANGGGDGDA
jgi:hypothetical protein